MLKNNFRWCVTHVETEQTLCEERIIMTLERSSKARNFLSPFGYIELRKEIECLMNNEHTDETATIFAVKQKPPLGRLKTGGIIGLEHLEDFIEKVIFNDPATIVKWKDGTKTVVKCQDGEKFDPMVGLAMCISKRAMGNQGNYFEVFKKYCEPWYAEQRVQSFNEMLLDTDSLSKAFHEIGLQIAKGFENGITSVPPINLHSEPRVEEPEVDPEKVCETCDYCRTDGECFHCFNPFVNKFIISNTSSERCPRWTPIKPKED